MKCELSMGRDGTSPNFTLTPEVAEELAVIAELRKWLGSEHVIMTFDTAKPPTHITFIVKGERPKTRLVCDTCGALHIDDCMNKPCKGHIVFKDRI